jgi:hypothetical protein
VRTCRATGLSPDTERMSFDLIRPRVVELDRGGFRPQAHGMCCDLCRRESQLYRLIFTPDALCEGCFTAWHG